MYRKLRRSTAGESVSSVVPPSDWRSVLETFSRERHGWLVELETHDLVTRENVISRPMPLQSLELDLEDEKNPRINVLVHLDNKIIKHILFLPSKLVLDTPVDRELQALRVETVNTETTVRFIKPSPEPAGFGSSLPK